MWSVLIYIFLFTLKTCTCLTVLSVLVIIGCRLYFEPVKEMCKCKTKLHGKVALVTGGNSGIGLETARDLARRGARVIIASRDVNKSAEAVRDIIETTGNLNVEYRHLDLSNFKNIRQFAKEFNNNEDRLDILVNNSGVGGIRNKLTEHGIDILMQINYFGPILLTNLLLDKLKKSPPSRIVVVSSKLHKVAKLDVKNLAMKNVESHWIRYGTSKLCNIIWTRALAKRLDGVTVNSLHPGLVKTNIFHRAGSFTNKIVLFLIEMFFKTAEEGAQTCIHLCVAPELENASGGFYIECKLVQDLPEQVKDDNLVEQVWNESMRLINEHNE